MLEESDPMLILSYWYVCVGVGMQECSLSDSMTKTYEDALFGTGYASLIEDAYPIQWLHSGPTRSEARKQSNSDGTSQTSTVFG